MLQGHHIVRGKTEYTLSLCNQACSLTPARHVRAYIKLSSLSSASVFFFLNASFYFRLVSMAPGTETCKAQPCLQISFSSASAASNSHMKTHCDVCASYSKNVCCVYKCVV